MAMSILARRLGSILRPGQFDVLRHLGAIPGVYNHLVEVTVLDREGIRHPIRGLEGQTLAQLLVEHPEISDGLVAPSPSGRGALDAHVLVSKEYLEKLPPPTEVDETDLIDLAEEHIMDNSRLASNVTLSPSMDGLTVAMGEIGFWRTL